MPASPIPIGPGTPETSRGDACPGALRLHAADDGALARVRVPGGVLTVAQARALGAAAVRFGDGVVRITSRGNVEVRGLDASCGAGFGAALQEAGLLPSAAHERVRNVVASPLSGLDGRGHVDVRVWLRELDRVLCASAVTPALSGKFLFALDDGRGDVASLGADVVVRGLPDGGGEVSLGEAGPFRVSYADAARAAVVIAEFFAEAARASGRRVWRAAELGWPAPKLTERLGRELAAAGVQVSPPGTRGTARPATTNPSPGDGPRGAAPDPAPQSPEGLEGAERHIEVTVPFGAADPTQWAALTELAPHEVRLTPWRGIVIPGATPHAAEELTRTGLVTDPASPWTRVGACIGRPGCAKSNADVRADAKAQAHTAHPHLPTYWSGCERRCGHPAGPYVDVVAQPDGTYAVTTERAEPRV